MAYLPPMLLYDDPHAFNPQMDVVACYVECQGKILLLLTAEGKKYSGLWGVPAGKREEGESHVQAERRELYEETGILTENCVQQQTMYVRHGGGDFLYTMFRCVLSEFPSVTLRAREHVDYRWIEPAEALALPLVTDEDACIRFMYPHVQ